VKQLRGSETAGSGKRHLNKTAQMISHITNLMRCANTVFRMQCRSRVWPALVLMILLGAGCSREAKKARYLERAERHYQAAQYDRAEIDYLNALRLDPGNEAANRRLGTIYFDQGRFPAAFLFLRRARQLDTNNVEVRVKLGLIFLSSRSFKEARGEALSVLADQPGNEDAVLMLADAAVAPQEIEDARQRIEGFHRQAGDRAAFHVALGTLALRQKDFGAAGTAFKRALALEPGSSAVQAALGNLYWAQSDLKRADDAFKAAAELAPLRSARRLKYADFKIKTGEMEAARRALEEISNKVPDRLPPLVRLAEIAFIEKKYKDCASLLEKIVRRDPVNYEGLMLSGRLNLAEGKAAKAIAEFERLSKSYPRVPQIAYHLGVAHLNNRDMAKAIASLNEAVNLDPNFSDAALLLAELNIKKGNAGLAVGALNRLIQQEPQNGQAHLLLANAYQAQRDLDAAVRVYRRMMELFPMNPQAPLFMGLVRVQQNKKTEAREAFEKAIEISPEYLPALEQLVHLDIADKQFDAVLQRVRKQVEQKPASAGLQLLLAKIFVAQRNLNEAEGVLLKAIELEPDTRAAYLLLAEVYFKANKHSQALDNLQRVLANNPKDVVALMQSAGIHTVTRDFNAARDAYERLLAANPNFAPALNNVAYLYSEHLGDLNKAYERARRARDLLPNDPAAADTLGWIHYQRGEYPLALSLLKESADRLPTEAEVIFHLGATHYMLGEEDPARIALQRALQLNTTFPGNEEAKRRLTVLSMDVLSADAKAVALFEKDAREHPLDPVVLARLAAIYERDGAVKKAAKAYENILELSPENVSAMANLARLCSDGPLQDLDRAFKLAKAARDAAPGDSSVLLVLSRIAFKRGDHPWAASLFEECIRQRPGDPEILHDLAWGYYSLGRIQEAEATMQSAVRTSGKFSRADSAKRFLAISALSRDPVKTKEAAAQIDQILKSDRDYLPALAAAGRIHEERGEAENAKRIYEQILDRHPHFAHANRRLAALYAENPSESQKAYDHAVKARATFPEDAEVTKVLGIVAYRRGEYAVAARWLKQSAEKLPGDGEVFYWLGMTCYRLKDETQSRQALQKALALNATGRFADDARRTLKELK
jgi:tetratricopeptide (TPR) repeat protein